MGLVCADDRVASWYRGRVMAILEELVAQVVSDVSERMKDPSYAQLAIGSFVQSQPHVSKYFTARMEHLGGGEAVMHAAFHGELLAECYRRERGSEDLPMISFVDLDAVHGGDAVARFREVQPALADYLSSNVDQDGMRAVLALFGLALDRA